VKFLAEERKYKERQLKLDAKKHFLEQSKFTAAELQARGYQLSPILFEDSRSRGVFDEGRVEKFSFIEKTKKLLLTLFGFIVNLIWLVIDYNNVNSEKYFLHNKNRSKREYYSELILHISTFYSITLIVLVLINYFILESAVVSSLYDIRSLVWYPDRALSLSYIYVFSAKTPFDIITNTILTVLIPFFVAGIAAGIAWKDDAKDVVGPSSFLSFLLFLAFFFNEIFITSSFKTSDILAGWFLSLLYESMLLIVLFQALILSLLGGALGVMLGISFSNIASQKNDEHSFFSPSILPVIPITVKTLFDMVDVSSLTTSSFNPRIMLVYLNRTIELNSKRIKVEHCPYFVEGRCAYLGYKTTATKKQICTTESYNSCRVLAFILQSKLLIKEIKEEEKNG